MRARAGTRARREEPVALTARQEEVLRLLERGLTNTEIASALGISLDGAKFHVSEIIGKLGVATREEAVEAWRQRRRARRFPALFSLPPLKWGAVTAAAGGVVVVAVLMALSSGEDSPALSEDETPEAQATATLVAEPTPTPEPVLAACPEPLATPGTGGGAITWARIVRFNGIVYVWAGELETPDALLGPPFGRVQFQFGDMVGPSYSIRDCDAAWLPPGTTFYAIDGYSPHFRIATQDGQIYEAAWGEGIQTAGDVADLRGKVTAIEFWVYDGEQSQLLATISDASQTAIMVEDYLAAPYDPGWLSREMGPENVVLTFRLHDGTVSKRNYDPESGFVWPAFLLPESFNEAARAAIAAGVE